MKKRSKRTLIIEIVIVLLVLCGIAYLIWVLYGQEDVSTDDHSPEIIHYQGDGDVFTLENDDLLLELDGETTYFTVTHKLAGTVWHSVPEGAQDDPVALSANKSRLQSTLTITYSTQNGVITQMDNYAYSIENKLYSIEQGDGYIRVNYTIGRLPRVYIIPQVITETKMNEWLKDLSKSKARRITDSYRLNKLDKLSDDERETFIQQYPEILEDNVYILRDTVQDHQLESYEEQFRDAGYTYEDFLENQNLFGEVGADRVAFSVSVIYRLEGDDLVVEIPLDDIGYYDEFSIIRITPLPNFGAAGVEDQGCFIVPEGSGHIINFNNGRTSQNSYVANVYGWDYATIRDAVINETYTSFPMFAEIKNGSAFLCMLEDYASVAQLNADISGRHTSYNNAYASYTALHYDAFNVSDRSIETFYMYEPQLPSGSIVQRYRFVETDDYVELALAYRDYLLARYPGLQPVADGQVPVAVEIVGAIDKVLQRGGLPVSLPVALTTYEQAGEIIADLSAGGFENLFVRLSGWANGGVKQRILTSVWPVSQLGTADELKAMVAEAAAKGVPVFLNGITQYALDSGFANGFFTLRDAARYTTRELVKLWEYSTVWYGQNEELEPYYLLQPRIAQTMIENLASAAQRYSAAGIALEDSGAILSGDYNPKKLVTREESMNMQRSALAAVKAGGQRVMIGRGNLYALEYADFVTDMELGGSNYAIFDKSIPFWQIALHGYVRYAGQPLNLADDWQQELLLSAERGAGLSFVFMHEEPVILHDTNYSGYFGANYAAWAGQAEEIYREYNAAMRSTVGQTITGHRYLTDEVTLTSYGNGTLVYVNFSSRVYNGDGVTVPVRSYLVLGGEQ